MAEAQATLDYPQGLVLKVKDNAAASERLADEQRTLGTELSQASADLEKARKMLSLFERVSGPVRKLVKRPTPALEEVWSGQEECSRLERLIGESKEKGRDVELATYSAITGYLFHSSERYRGLASDQRCASAALSESADYLGLVEGAAGKIDGLVQQVMSDWPRHHRPPFPLPPGPWPQRKGPVRIMAEGEESQDGIPPTRTCGTPSAEDAAPALYDPEDPELPEVPDDFRQPRLHPPQESWPDYWRIHWRYQALKDCQAAVAGVKARKAGCADAMRQYASQRNDEAGPLPGHWDSTLSGVEATVIDDVPWYSLLHPAAFIYALGNVHSQLANLGEGVRSLQALPEKDLRSYSDGMSDMAMKVRQDILASE